MSDLFFFVPTLAGDVMNRVKLSHFTFVLIICPSLCLPFLNICIHPCRSYYHLFLHCTSLSLALYLRVPFSYRFSCLLIPCHPLLVIFHLTVSILHIYIQWSIYLLKPFSVCSTFPFCLSVSIYSTIARYLPASLIHPSLYNPSATFVYAFPCICVYLHLLIYMCN